MKKALLLINSLPEDSTADELDVLVQAAAVESALDELGYNHTRAFFDLNLETMRDILTGEAPDVVFNLVETVDGKGSLIHLPPSLLEALKIPFTGSGSYSLLVTTDKIRTKEILEKAGIPTPVWILPGDHLQPAPDTHYILKPVWEDGSAGITDESVVKGQSFDMNHFRKDKKYRDYFLEEYIDGREFNITLLAGPDGAEVMPPAEMLYVDYPENKPKILNFASKWDTDSFEYGKTIRTFDLQDRDVELAGEMKRISLLCWDLFDIKGYARVDIRVNRNNRPFVLEVNTNPCLSPDAGFTAACAEGGVHYTEMIQRILTDAR